MQTQAIDPISLNITYSDRSSRYQNRFGFGLQLGRTKKRSIRSKQIKLDIQPLPVEGMPKNFTGLVGKHNFQLKTNKTKYLANEPIEFQLVVAGEGALEVFDAPALLNHPLVEEFETNSFASKILLNHSDPSQHITSKQRPCNVNNVHNVQIINVV